MVGIKIEIHLTEINVYVSKFWPFFWKFEFLVFFFSFCWNYFYFYFLLLFLIQFTYFIHRMKTKQNKKNTFFVFNKNRSHLQKETPILLFSRIFQETDLYKRIFYFY